MHELDDPNLLLQLVVSAGALMFAVMVWAFWPEVTAPAIYINSASYEVLVARRGDHFTTMARMLEVALFLYGIAGYGVNSIARRSTGRITPGAIGLAVAVPVLALILLRAFPYRIMVHDAAERVDLGDQRCYEIGQADGQVLLHCPELMPPRNVVVSKSDQRLRPRGVIQSIFTPATDSKPLQ